MVSAPPDTIIAETVVVRRESRADAAVIAALVGENLDRLAEFMPWATAYAVSPQNQLDRISLAAVRWETGDEFDYVITVEETVVGKAGLRRGGSPGSMEIGYWIGQAWEGRGYVRAAVIELTDVAFELDGVSRVEIHCDEANHRSAAVARSTGYTLERTVPAEIAARGQTGVSQVWVRERGQVTRP